MELAPELSRAGARAATLAVSQAADIAAEQARFTYLGGRDITGFIDGTANPQVRRAADVALMPPGQPGEGGSHVLVMRWVHDLTAFERLSVEEQQRVIGRTKTRARPLSAHIELLPANVAGRDPQLP